jgi:hypothetical protein
MFRSITFRCQLVGVVACIAATASLQAEILKFDVVPAFAPNGPVSPSWLPYVTNALTGIEADGAEIGDRLVSPEAYEPVTGPVPPFEMIYTEFPSWRGLADPTGAFSGEMGNRVHFGLHLVAAPTTPFSLSQLEWSLDSDDIDNYFDQSDSFADANYSPTRIGIHYGTDGQRGGGDDIVYDNGELGTNEIHEFVYVGVGDGFVVGDTGPLTNQEEIDDVLRTMLEGAGGGEVKFTGTYTLNDPDSTNPVIASGIVKIRVDFGFGGDFSRRGGIDCPDADLLTPQVASGANDILFDVTGDGLVNFDDIDHWVHDIAGTHFGDANCDKAFSTGDLVKLFQAGKYETGQPAVWSEGDFNGNGTFGTEDLVVAFIDGGFDPNAAVSPVPEPGSVILLLIGSIMLVRSRRKAR